jgi:hypothetical protein
LRGKPIYKAKGPAQLVLYSPELQIISSVRATFKPGKKYPWQICTWNGCKPETQLLIYEVFEIQLVCFIRVTATAVNGKNAQAAENKVLTYALGEGG